MNSADIVLLDRAHSWHPYTQMQTAPAPLPIASAQGVYLYTYDGRRILDGISSWWVNIHGHSHPRLNEALAQQASQMEHVMFAGFTHEPATLLAEELVRVLPRGLERIFYSDNGSTAVEVWGAFSVEGSATLAKVMGIIGPTGGEADLISWASE